MLDVESNRFGQPRRELREELEGGLHIAMMSRTRGHLAGFPAWDHADRDLRHFTDIPLGTEEEPFEDADEAGASPSSPPATTSSSSKATPPAAR
jgi:hypothetical protein